MQVLQAGGLIYSKSSGTSQTFNMNKIFTSGNPCNLAGDTRVLFDPSAGSNGRWFAAAINQHNGCDGITKAYADIAVSPTNDPTTALSPPNPWKDFRTIVCWDHPEIAVTSNTLVLTSNAAPCSPTPPKLLVYNKNDLVNQFSSNPPALGFQDLTGQVSSTCVGQSYPVRNLSPTSREYMVCQGSGTPIPFYLFSIDGTPNSGTPNASCCAAVSQILLFQMTSIVPARCCIQSNVSQTNGFPMAIVPSVSGAPYCPSASYCVVPVFSDLSAVWSNNWLWFAVPALCSYPDNSQWDCIRLVQLTAYSAPSTASPILDQTFDLKQEGVDFFLPAISMDGINDLAMVFAYSSSSIYPSLGITGQGFTDPSGTLATWQPLKVGAGYDSVEPKNRFSDFFGAALDPSDSTLLWVTGAYFPQLTCGTDSLGRTIPCWASWVASFRVVGLSLSSSSFVNNLGTSANTVTVAVQARAGFSGTVNLSPMVSSGGSNGPTASMSPASLSLVVGGSGSSVATVTTQSSNCPQPNCGFSLKVQAVYSGQAVILVIPFTVVYFDYGMSASPSSFDMWPAYEFDTSASITLTATLVSSSTWTNSSVAFTVSGQPGYMQVAFSPSSIVPTTSGSTVTVTFTIPAFNRITTTVTYSVTISGSGFGRTHSTGVSIKVHPDCTQLTCTSSPIKP